MAELISIPRSKIDMIKNYRDVEPVSPNDPDVIELAGSITKLGILQPVLVRPKHHSRDRYELIFGHRRYVACDVAGIHDIPCNVMNVADEEILELQVTENLQRKDVHPMDEAVAFRTLIDVNHETVEDLQSKFGKSGTFIRQRLRLTTLTPDWQKVFLRGKIPISDALRVAALAQKDQKDLFDNQNLTKEELKTGKFSVRIQASELMDYKGDLSRAAFDITDPALDKKMGACTSCTFNTAVASLFPEAAQNSHCTKTASFKGKIDKAFKGKLSDALSDPKVVFVTTDYNTVKKDIDAIEKEYSIQVMPYASFNELDPPEQPEYDRFLDDLYDAEDMSAEEIKAEWDKEMTAYERELGEYKAKVEKGRYKKAFVVSGEEKGRLIYISVNKKKADQPSGKADEDKDERPKSAEVRIAEIDAEMAGIKTRLERGLEIDLEKIHKATVEKLEDNPALEKPGLKHQGQADRGILVFLLLHELARMSDDDIRLALKKKLPKEPQRDESNYQKDYIIALGAIDDDDMAFMVRKICMEKYSGRNLQYGISVEDSNLRIIAEYLGVDLAAIEAEQKLVAEKRIGNANKRLEALKKEKKDLSAPKAKSTGKAEPGKSIKSLLDQPAAKSTGPKKAVKKTPAKKKAVPAKGGGTRLIDMTDEELDEVDVNLNFDKTDDDPEDWK